MTSDGTGAPKRAGARSRYLAGVVSSARALGAADLNIIDYERRLRTVGRKRGSV
jgi:hypothetical protein